VYKAAQDAVSLARKGGGPSLIEAKTYRWKGHVGPEEDWTKGCRPKEELDYWKEQCPVKRFTELLMDKGALTSGEIEDIKLAITAEITALSVRQKKRLPADVKPHLDRITNP
jgi:pyruvate dehydrogenase E1 component alpha subunit